MNSDVQQSLKAVFQADVYRNIKYRAMPERFVRYCHGILYQDKITLQGLQEQVNEEDIKEYNLRNIQKYSFSDFKKSSFVIKPKKQQLLRYISNFQFQSINLFYFILDLRPYDKSQCSLLLADQDEQKLEKWKAHLIEVLEGNNTKAMSKSTSLNIQTPVQLHQHANSKSNLQANESKQQIQQQQEDQSNTNMKDMDDDDGEFQECLEYPSTPTQQLHIKQKQQTKRWKPYTRFEGCNLYKDSHLSYMSIMKLNGTPRDVFKQIVKEFLMSHEQIFYMHKKVDQNTQILRYRREAPIPLNGIMKPLDVFVRRVWRKESDGTYVINYRFDDLHEYQQDIQKQPTPDDIWRDHQTQSRGQGIFFIHFLSLLSSLESIAISISPLKEEAMHQYGYNKEHFQNLLESEYSVCSLVTLVAKMKTQSPLNFLDLCGLLNVSEYYNLHLYKELMQSVLYIRDKMEVERFVSNPFDLDDYSQPTKDHLDHQTSEKQTINERQESLNKQSLESIDKKQDWQQIKNLDQDQENLIMTNSKYYSCPGPSSFKVRGPNYLKDKVKINAGQPKFQTVGLELLEVRQPTKHISRYLPAVRQSKAAFTLVVNYQIPRRPHTNFVIIFAYDQQNNQIENKIEQYQGQQNIGTPKWKSQSLRSLGHYHQHLQQQQSNNQHHKPQQQKQQQLQQPKRQSSDTYHQNSNHDMSSPSQDSFKNRPSFKNHTDIQSNCIPEEDEETRRQRSQRQSYSLGQRSMSLGRNYNIPQDGNNNNDRPLQNNNNSNNNSNNNININKYNKNNNNSNNNGSNYYNNGSSNNGNKLYSHQQGQSQKNSNRSLLLDQQQQQQVQQHQQQQQLQQQVNNKNSGMKRRSSNLDNNDEDTEERSMSPFELTVTKFLLGSDQERHETFKMIPYVVEGSWLIKQSVGCTPVIIGNKLETEYFQGPRYLEVCINVGSNSVANNVTQMVAGVLNGQTIDLGFILEGKTPEELPESLLGSIRIHKLDFKSAVKLDTSKEVESLHLD